jgi:steroid delta-isomerase-like uncharacterized protein
MTEGPPVSLDSTQRTMRGYVDALVGDGDISPFLAEDVAWTTTETGDEVRGRETVREFIRSFHTGMFRARPEVRRLAVADGVAVLEADFVGRHTGTFAGIPPTGAAVRLPYCVVYDVADGVITAMRAYFPVACMVRQLRAAAVP